MYNYAHRDLFYRDELDDYIVLSTEILVDEENEEYETIYITPDDIEEGTFEFYESITDSESFNLQNCRSSYVQFTTFNTEYSFYGCWFEMTKVIVRDAENEIYDEIPLGYFYVVEDNLSRDGMTQDIVAYDALYFVINTNPEQIKTIYNSINFPCTIKDLRDNFFNAFDIEQDNVALINDDIVIPKQLSDEDLVSGDMIVKMIAELNAVFPHIGKDGLLTWIRLDVGDPFEQGLYPGFYPSEHAYPGTGYPGYRLNIYKEQYIEDSVIWANYSTMKPDGVQIRDENNNIAYFANSENSKNPYIIINNFLCYGLSYGQYQQIAERLYKRIKHISYVPFEMQKMADPCIEVGDRVLVHTQENVLFISYIFNKHTSEVRNQFEDIQTSGTYDLSQYDINTNTTAAKVKNLDNRVGNIEKSGSGPLQIVSVAALPDNPQLNVLYLIQGEVTVT